MNLTIRNAGIPSLMSDWLNSDFFGPDLTDVEFFNGKRLGVTVPSANIAETDKEFTIDLAAPGLTRKDFKLESDNHILTVSAEKRDEKEDEAEGYSRREYSYNSFSRSFTLPENVKEDKIDAKYQDGVLKIIVPKKEASPKKNKKQISVA